MNCERMLCVIRFLLWKDRRFFFQSFLDLKFLDVLSFFCLRVVVLLACIYPIFDPGKVLIVLQFILSLFIEKMLSDCTVYSVCLSVQLYTE